MPPDMKKILFLAAAVLATQTGLAAESLTMPTETSNAVPQGAPVWRYEMPSTGVLPSALSYEFASRMRERHSGSSRFSMQNVSLAVPFSNPRASSIGAWAFNAELDATVTSLDVDGSLDLRHDTLYNLTLPLSFIRQVGAGNRVVLALAPSVSTDFVHMARCFDLGAMASYTVRRNERFSYTLGLGLAPRFSRYYGVPVLGFEWKPTDDWTIALNGYRFSAMNHLGGGVSVGVFASSTGGTWSVDTQRGSRNLRVQSLVLGVAGEYDFAGKGQTKRILTAAIGSTVATSVRFCRQKGSQDADEAHHYRPGFYASVGLDFRF